MSGTRDLRPRELCCEICGIGILDPDESHVVARIRLTFSEYADISMTRCEICRELATAARALLDKHPSVEHSIGSPSVALERVESALVALSVLGIGIPRREKLTASAAALSALTAKLFGVGRSARWAVHYSERPTIAAEARFSHLTLDERGLIRHQFVATLAARVEVPQPVLAPDEACGYCGISAVSALPSHADEVWTEHRRVSVRSLGGIGPDAVNLSLCPTCEGAVQFTGALGVTSRENALLRFLDVPAHGHHLSGVIAWAISGAPPNDEPWQHLAGTDQLARELRQGIPPGEAADAALLAALAAQIGG